MAKIDYKQKLSPSKTIAILLIAVGIGYTKNYFNHKEVEKLCIKHKDIGFKLMELRQDMHVSKDLMKSKTHEILIKKGNLDNEKIVDVYINKLYEYPLVYSKEDSNQMADKFSKEVYDLCISKDTKVYE